MAEKVRTGSRGSRYVNELLRLRCGGQLVASRYFPNAREVEESFGVWSAVQRALGALDQLAMLKDPNVWCFVPGDGATPRTGATAAMRSRWRVFSIDPRLRSHDPQDHGIEGLTVLRMRAEGAPVEQLADEASLVVILAVHSHADLRPMVDRIHVDTPLLVVALPCCIDLEAGWAPAHDYRDPDIHCEHNRVVVWHRGIHQAGEQLGLGLDTDGTGRP